MLFWVTTRGRDRIFNKPRDSAMVRTAASRNALLAFTKLKPLFGADTPRFENSGIWTPPVPPVTTGYSGFGVFPTLSGEVPAEVAPPMPVGLLPQPNPS